MLETTRPAPVEDLRFQAMLYAAGEMDSVTAQAFETRLETDPNAQQALVQAVQMAGLLDGRSYAPDPGYRDAVRATVRAKSRPVRRQRSALLWVSGTCAAAMALLTIGSLLQREPANKAPQPKFVQAEPPRNEPLPPVEITPKAKTQIAANPPAIQPEERTEPAELEDALGAAEAWAELTNYERLRKVLEFELRRKLRMRLYPDDFRIQGQLTPSQMVE
jgi:hypothetical protein